MSKRGISAFSVNIQKDPLQDRYVIIPFVKDLESGGGVAIREGFIVCEFSNIVENIRYALAVTQKIKEVSGEDPLIIKEKEIGERTGVKDIVKNWYETSFSLDTEGYAPLQRERNTFEVNPLRFTGRGSIGQHGDPRFILPLDVTDEQIGDAIKKSFDWIQENFGHLVKGREGK